MTESNPVNEGTIRIETEGPTDLKTLTVDIEMADKMIDKDRAKFEKTAKEERFLKGQAGKNARFVNQIVIPVGQDKQTPPNAPCPCKSGKKHKKCCQYN